MAWILQKGFPFCPNRPCSMEKGKVLFFHHLVRISLPILQGDLHQVLPWHEALQVDAFQAIALCAHQAALQVVKLDLCGLYVGRVLQVEPVLGGVGVEEVGTC